MRRIYNGISGKNVLFGVTDISAHGHTWGLLPACSPKGEEHIRKLLCRNRLRGLSWKGTSQSRLFATASKQPACPQSDTGGEVKRRDWSSSIRIEGMNSLLLTEKEAIHVTQIAPDSTDSRGNSSCGSRRLSPWKCFHTGT